MMPLIAAVTAAAATARITTSDKQLRGLSAQNVLLKSILLTLYSALTGEPSTVIGERKVVPMATKGQPPPLLNWKYD
jgi:hypothetical protein